MGPASTDPTDAHLRLAGFALAHALGSIDAGGTLCTLAFVERQDQRELVRYDADSIADSIALARNDLRTSLEQGGYAALVYDGYATVGDVRHDALMVDLIDRDGTVVAQLVQQYRPGRLWPFGLLRLVGLPLPGGLVVVGDAIAQSPLRPAASVEFTRGLADHPYGRRTYRLSAADRPPTV